MDIDLSELKDEDSGYVFKIKQDCGMEYGLYFDKIKILVGYADDIQESREVFIMLLSGYNKEELSKLINSKQNGRHIQCNSYKGK